MNHFLDNKLNISENTAQTTQNLKSGYKILFKIIPFKRLFQISRKYVFKAFYIPILNFVFGGEYYIITRD